MEMEIIIPDALPIMTLPNVAFFPQALMPLHIFEPRYRHMLRDVLSSNRLFVVAGLDNEKVEQGDIEPPHRVATVGLVRACQESEDGTSNLLLQGICRVAIRSIESDSPYRRVRVQTLASEAGASADENQTLRRELGRLLSLKQKLGAGMSRELTAFLRTVEDPEAFVDIAAFSLCDDSGFKQRLLETLDVHRRLELFREQVRGEIEALKLRRKLQGPLSDDRISQN